MPDPTRKHAPVKLTKGWHLRRQSPFGQSSVSRLRFLFTIPRIMCFQHCSVIVAEFCGLPKHH